MVIVNRVIDSDCPQYQIPDAPSSTVSPTPNALVAADNMFDEAESNALSYITIPSSPVIDLIMKIMISGGDRDKLLKYGAAAYHINDFEVQVGNNGDQLVVRQVQNNAQICVAVEGVLGLKGSGSNASLKKLFLLLLSKICPVVHSGRLSSNHITVFTQELVDLGMYSSRANAKRAMKVCSEILLGIRVKGRLNQKGKKGSAYQREYAALFLSCKPSLACVTYELNPSLNWGFLLQYFTIMPMYAFSLSNRAFDLLYTVLYLARQQQNTRAIQRKGVFLITLQTVHRRLMLKDGSQTKNPQKLIRQPIMDSIAEINQADAIGDINLSCVCNEAASIRDFLWTGHIQVSISGMSANFFCGIAETINCKRTRTYSP